MQMSSIAHFNLLLIIILSRYYPILTVVTVKHTRAPTATFRTEASTYINICSGVYHNTIDSL